MIDPTKRPTAQEAFEWMDDLFVACNEGGLVDSNFPYCPPDHWSSMHPSSSQSKDVWDGLAPVLSSRGIALQGTTDFEDRPLPPTNSPKNPFQPGPDEAFVHILSRYRGDSRKCLRDSAATLVDFVSSLLYLIKLLVAEHQQLGS